MIAPVLEKGAKGRRVYLPEPMTEVRFSRDGFTCAPAEAGERTVEVPLNEVVFYIRQNHLVPVGKAAANTAALDLGDVELVGSGSVYQQYIDDGSSRNCGLEHCVTLHKE